MNIILEQKSDKDEIEKLLDLTFGVGRHKKPAYRLRENVEAIKELSFVIRDDGKLIATLRFWPVQIKNNPALLLGPIAVLPQMQGQGYGIEIMRRGLEIAKDMGHSRVILVGDEDYYSKVGFNRNLAVNLWIKRQTNHRRILACELVPGSFDKIHGEITTILSV